MFCVHTDSFLQRSTGAARSCCLQFAVDIPPSQSAVRICRDDFDRIDFNHVQSRAGLHLTAVRGNNLMTSEHAVVVHACVYVQHAVSSWPTMWTALDYTCNRETGAQRLSWSHTDDKHGKNHLFVLSRVFYQIIVAKHIWSYCTATGPD